MNRSMNQDLRSPGLVKCIDGDVIVAQLLQEFTRFT